MADQTIVPMFDPQGQLRDVPYEKMNEARQNGMTIGVRMKFEGDGDNIRYVPATKVQEAVQNKGTIQPIEEQAVQHKGFWSTLMDDVKSFATPSAVSPYPGMDLEAKQNIAQQSRQDMQQRRDAGYSLPYRAAAPVVQGLGVNVSGMEQSAREGDPGGVLAHATASAAPVVLAEGGRAVGAIGKAARPLVQETAEHLYQSSLKPSNAKFAPNPADVVRTGLDAGIPISKEGLDRLGTMIDDYNNKISDTIKQGANQGKTISKYDVAGRLSNTVDRFSTQVNPGADLKAIQQSGEEFLANQPDKIPVDRAQDLKVGTYKQLKGRAYGELGSATIEAQKSLARGIKEELQTQFPEIKNLNAQEGKLLDLDGALEKAVARIGNRDLIGLGTSAAGVAGAVAGGAPAGGIAALLKMIVDNPTVKSRLAIALSRGARGSGQLSTVSSRLAAYSAGLANASNAQANASQSEQQ